MPVHAIAEGLAQIVATGIVYTILGILSVLFTLSVNRALFGQEEDERVEAAGGRTEWQWVTMGSRTPALPVRWQLAIIGLILPLGGLLLWLSLT